MDFSDSREERAFREEVRAWLEANAQRHNPGEPSAWLFSEDSDEGMVDRARRWQAKKADEGWAGITWPTEYGGRGGTLIQQVIWDQEESHFRAPPNLFAIGIGITGPVLMRHGDDTQKQRYLPPMLRGDEIWSQLFSEPGAGSDLAGIKTRAVRDGDGWVVNGQKVWSSGAHYSRFATILTRTDPTAPKHEGLTDFIIDLDSPGVEIRPIKQIVGGSHFNEVFLTDVRIPDESRLSEVGEGWSVAMTTLMNERVAAGFAGGISGRDLEFGDLLSLARVTSVNGRPAIEDAEVRQRLASFYVRLEAMRFTGYRILTAMSKGAVPGAEASIGKLVHARLWHQMAGMALELQGPLGSVADEDLAHHEGAWQEAYLTGPALRLAGGTDEIMRNVIGERVLGLPPDIRVDKDVPFNEIPTGSRLV